MDKIEEIYKNVLQDTGVIREQRAILESKVEDVLKEEKGSISRQAYESHRDSFYEVAMIAEQGGFKLGFQYAVQLLAECCER
ncbi:MAG: hypothetical protein HFH03_11160 [Dorea sp.]|jgi:hypothetical protein|nr:hypothetical protein [Dorea sp.]